jgi:hypothetical protein
MKITRISSNTELLAGREHGVVTKDAVPVYAVLRIDMYEPTNEEGDQLNAGSGLSFHVTVKEVLPSMEEARAEVQRLNALKEGRGVRYMWQYSRYFPDGRAGGDTDA